MIKHIIFDLDGTLIDSARLTGQIIDEMLADCGVTTMADRAKIRHMDAVGGEAMIAAVMGQHSQDPAADLTEFRVRHRTAITPADLTFPGVSETLSKLADAGIGLAICSNKPQFLCDKILADLGLGQHFRTIIGSDPSRPKKPAPQAARLALERLGAEADDTLYCGDSEVDFATAQAAGLPMVLVRWGYGAEAVLAKAPEVPTIHTMEDLLGMMHRNKP